MQNFDREAAGRVEIERPRAVQAGRLWDLVAIVSQTLVDLVDPLLALLNETDMKAGWIFHFGAFCHAEQRQHQAVVVGQKAHGFARLRASVTLQAKVFFQEMMGFRNIGDGEIQVVELHAQASGVTGAALIRIHNLVQGSQFFAGASAESCFRATGWQLSPLRLKSRE
jgi:hypothetical protein